MCTSFDFRFPLYGLSFFTILKYLLIYALRRTTSVHAVLTTTCPPVHPHVVTRFTYLFLHTYLFPSSCVWVRVIAPVGLCCTSLTL
jgi:hypothetical protein